MSISISEFTNTLTRITEGGTGSEAVSKFNTPLSQVETDLNTLAERIAGLNDKSAIVQYYAPCISSVTVGALVYYNIDNARYEPAIAQLEATPGSQGESIEAACARVEGIVLARTSSLDESNNVLCTIMRGGFWQDNPASPSVVQGCLGTSAVSGMYYLSPTNAGKAVLDPGDHLRQGILMYHGNGAFSMSLFYLAHDNHFHASCELTGTWNPVSTLPTDVTEAPSGAYWWYNASADSNMTNLGTLSSTTTAVFYNGALQKSTDNFVINDGYLWYKIQAGAPAAHTVTLFNHYPFAYGSSVIRSVVSSNTGLTVKTVNGTVTLIPNDFVDAATTNNATAISSIAGRNIAYTPVVSGLSAGAGIVITSYADGTANIASSDKIGTPLDAYSVNHNGTNQVSDGNFLYFAFPKGRSSELIISLPITGIESTTTLQAAVWGWCANTGVSFNVSFYWVPAPTPTTNTLLPTTATATATLTFTGSTGYLSYSEATSANAVFQGEGLLAARIAIASVPTDDIKLLRLGFKMTNVSASTSSASSTIVTSVHAVTNTIAAGAQLAKYAVVQISNGALVICQSNTAAHCNKCVGVTLASAENGDSVEYIITGVITDSSLSLTAGGSVYIGPTGALTQVDPSTDSSALFVQKIGTALSATSMQISIESGILKE